MTTTVTVLDDYQGVAATSADWASLGPDVRVETLREHVADPAVLADRLQATDVLVVMRERTPVTAGLLRRLPRLRLLVTTGMANAAVDLDAARAQGLTVCGTRGSSHSTVEHVWALILASARHVAVEDASLRTGGWQHTMGLQLHGSRLGLVGLGRIGGRVATVAHAFGMEVLAWSTHLTAERAAECGARLTPYDDLLATCDVVSVHVRLSERTTGLVGARELALMRPTAHLVNTSRGPVVDTDALVAALRAGRLAGAALDVFDTEPLPAGHPLRSAPRTTLTPHLGYVTAQQMREWFAEVVEDIAAWQAGSPVRVL